jgi:tetratricopeptide (TPR) repeat protein
MLHDHQEAESYTSAAVDRARASQDADGLAIALAYRFYFLIVDGQMEDAAAIRTELEALESIVSPAAFMQFRAVAPGDDRWRGAIIAALDNTELSISSVGAGGRTLALIRQAWVRSLALGEIGRFEEGIELGQRAVADAERLGERMYRARHLNTIGWLHAELFDPTAAIGWNERSLSAATDIRAPDPEIECNARLNLVENYLGLNDLSDIDLHMNRVRSIVVDPGLGDWFGHWRFSQRYHYISGLIALRREDPRSALDFAENCLRLAVEKSAHKNVIKAKRIRMLGLTQLDEREQAIAETTSALQVAEDLGLDPQIWRTQVAAASVAVAFGDTSAAAEATTNAQVSLHRLSLHIHESRRADFLERAEADLTSN